MVDKKDELYVAVGRYDEINKDMKSIFIIFAFLRLNSIAGEKAFDSEDAARQDANKKNSVRFRVVSECQEDFESALNVNGATHESFNLKFLSVI